MIFDSQPVSPYAAFAQTAARLPDHHFVHVPASALRHYAAPGDAAPGALTLTYAQTLAEIERQAARYRAAGYRAGMRVALLLENRPAFFFHFFALNSLGVGVVPLNPDARPHEIAYVAQHSEIALAVGVARTLPLLRAALDTPALHVPIADADAGPLPDATDAGDANDTDTATHVPSLDDECAILYTSGTTGKPKGCILDNRYFVSIGAMYLDEGGLCEVRPGVERLITPLPLFHMNALACSTMAMVLSGGCVIQLDRFHPRAWWSDVAASGATIVHYLGVMPAILLSLDDAPPPHSVRFGYGANVDPRHQRVFEQRFGFPLIEGWAMTETGGAAVISSSHEPRHVGSRCFGRPRPEIEVRLVDEHDRDVPRGTPGHLLVRRAGDAPRLGFFRGYLKDEAATEAAWRGGWFHTGDVVREGEDGSLHFVDRQKNVIRRSGENIAALEVEACLLDHPDVRQTAVIAAPDPLRDEEVMACVIVAPGVARDAATARALQAWCLDRLAYFKAPGYVSFVESLPVTSTNKVQKTQLAVLGNDPLNAPQCFDLRAFKRRVAVG
ncbi:AMP-binding protein [Paraburkholderia silvatlantica]|uniref:Acyl-CoA synthetase (AMP-forming)/AMP-acid ligase II n=1 Tax=Paraburkholderia silvatlantica TaxID=321895 RepID=A0A2U1A9U1_9BURK|nr:AMP-binding protein [Paraburkholderia silvatlantica]MBB2930628.1 acyl-CoA synthetase (AMP-forming)/AMP-acid ligase II [Paraburkholderia silvatlantica]PVY30429.1 acyl-CoA synthetase (AMP-forming)/AMP-acid ligase II [Paraburkholderia silvatlantica]PXW36834.1 acyl-CoA synthetase (AMP-forming)/AMP-acid ligase II [Paraburkholderia silvatlantica]PYE21175.1 acyl-CoA synthetase (AMP-forming)/AMP-acid ligase II [Paraburkholderia silvatlantica]TDQ86684.1 acyl-CoA synthetase (AMP-forming)/AMP-acid lig